MGVYHRDRGWENLPMAFYDGVGLYDTPEVAPIYVYDIPGASVEITKARKYAHPESAILHFFTDDYQINRLWIEPGQYMQMVRRYQYVISPDFSMYTDYPLAIQIYNHYRRHWLAKYWQDNGAKVIPNVSWSDEDSWSWCFDGDPIGSTVAVSSVGTLKTQTERTNFIMGYFQMLTVLRPLNVVFYGDIPEECTVPSTPILHIEPFQKKFDKFHARNSEILEVCNEEE